MSAHVGNVTLSRVRRRVPKADVAPPDLGRRAGGKMPTYVYRNLVNGETFEVQQRMTDDALTVHPETGDPVKRLIQPVGSRSRVPVYVNDPAVRPRR